MKKPITVLAVETDGIRGLQLEETKEQWSVSDSGFWPFAQYEAGNGDAAGEDAGGNAAPEEQPDLRYDALVDALKDASKHFGTHEVVLSMPLLPLIAQVVRTSAAERDNLEATAAEELGKLSPFPDETPVVGIETVAESDADISSLIAALPESGTGDIGDALDEAKIRVVRTDIAALGWLRSLWSNIFTGQDGESGTEPPAARRVVLLNPDGGWDIVVMDGSSPSLLRGLGRIDNPANLSREVMLSLIKAGAAANPVEIVLVTNGEADTAIAESLSALAPVRTIVLENPGPAANGENAQDPAGSLRPTLFGGVEGVARRAAENAALDITPAAWVELRTETRFMRKLAIFGIAALSGWLLAMGVLFGVPFAYGQMENRQKTLSKRHAAAYGEVKEMRDKVRLVQQYSDHARGALELLKAVSDRLPQGVTLTSFGFKRGDRLSMAGEAEKPTDVYDFKNALADAETAGGDDGEKEKLFAAVTLTGPSQGRGGMNKFSVECTFDTEEEGK